MKARFVMLAAFAGVVLTGAAVRAQDVTAPVSAAPAPPTAAPEATPALAAAQSTALPAEPAAGPAEQAALPAEPANDSFTSADASTNMLVGEDGPKLELYGFADFSYFHALGRKDSLSRQYIAPYPTFYVGHLNLYLSSTLGERWRSLAEIRFTYSPVGDENQASADGTFPSPDTTVADYAEMQRAFSWGGIEIQRAWVEYQPFDFLSIRAGQWLTPYGYWNDDHGSPTIIAVHKPFPITDTFFPEHQTGLVAHGKYFIGSTAIGYAATLSNGRGPYDTFRDLDNNKAVGGRLYLESTALGNLTIGVDGYRGRFTASTKRYRVDTSGGNPVAIIYRTKDSAYDELSLGVDLRWIYGGLHVQGELMTNEARYDERYRPRTVGFDPRPTFVADYRRVGAYVLAGYRTSWLNLMPYVLAEYSSYTESDLAPPVRAWSAGLNLRPTPNVVLKAELAIATFDGVGSTGLGKDDLSYFGSQIAWAF
jgi:hypothetical protein